MNSKNENNIIYKIYTESTTKSHDIYLSDTITNYCHGLLHFLREVPKRDNVNIYLSSSGGYIQQGVTIINAIRDCHAPVNIIIDSPCYSMAATIALCGSSIQFKNNTFLMFHNYSSSESGKGAEILSSVRAHNEWIFDIFDNIYYPFLTTDEIQKLKLDQDIYIHYNDSTLQNRVNRHFKKNNKK